jgi:hypothetical protein
MAPNPISSRFHAPPMRVDAKICRAKALRQQTGNCVEANLAEIAIAAQDAYVGACPLRRFEDDLPAPPTRRDDGAAALRTPLVNWNMSQARRLYSAATDVGRL